MTKSAAFKQSKDFLRPNSSQFADTKSLFGSTGLTRTEKVILSNSFFENS